MHEHRVGADHRHSAPRLGGAPAARELAGAEVGEQHDAGRDVAHAEEARQLGPLQSHALATHTHGQSETLRRRSKQAVEREALLGAAGHGCDHQRRAQRLSGKRDGQVQLGERDLGKRLVGEIEPFQPRGFFVLHRLRQAGFEVPELGTRVAQHSAAPRFGSSGLRQVQPFTHWILLLVGPARRKNPIAREPFPPPGGRTQDHRPAPHPPRGRA